MASSRQQSEFAMCPFGRPALGVMPTGEAGGTRLEVTGVFALGRCLLVLMAVELSPAASPHET